MTDHDIYLEQTRQRLRECNARVDDLNARAPHDRAEARDRMSDLRQRRADVEATLRWLEQLRRNGISEAMWSAMCTRLETSCARLDTAIQSAARLFPRRNWPERGGYAVTVTTSHPGSADTMSGSGSRHPWDNAAW